MGKRRPGQPSTWSMIILALVAILFFNAFAGTPSSPLEKLLHMHQAPKYLPLVFAAVFGLILGVAFNRRQQPGQRPGGGATGAGAPVAGGRGGADKPATRGRYAIPRHLRRQQERVGRRAAAEADRARRAADEEERLAREAADRRKAEAAQQRRAPAALRNVLARFGAGRPRRGRGTVGGGGDAVAPARTGASLQPVAAPPAEARADGAVAPEEAHGR